MLDLPPLAVLLIMLAVAAIVRLTILQQRPSATAGGCIVMAIGIFGQAALQRIPFLPSLLSEILALSLGVIWLFIAVSFVIDFLKGRFHEHTDSLIGRFGIGTWIAATVVLARMQMIGVPTWSIAIEEAFGVIAALLWLWYMALVLAGLNAIRRRHDRLHADGVILLSTVSTQAVALVAVDLSYAPTLVWIDYWTAHQLFHTIATVLNLLGALFYVVCLVLIVQRYWRQQGWTLVDDWANTNCIIHGGVSITGLTAVLNGTVSINACVVLWCVALALLLVVEGVEIVRAVQRVRQLGWRTGLLTYHVSQWARNFTFGMFYAFTWVMVAHFYAFLPPAMLGVLQWILEYGSHWIMALLIAQMTLYLSAHIRAGRPGPAA